MVEHATYTILYYTGTTVNSIEQFLNNETIKYCCGFDGKVYLCRNC
jgi:hypothetical protein